MRRVPGILVLSILGCSGFAAPTSEQLRLLPPPAPLTAPTLERLRIQMSLDSPWLAGEFDGVVLVRRVNGSPTIRLQLFGDLGPKMVDLLARPDRVTAYFPQAREGIDCALPRDASPHPLLFMGASLIEKFSPATADRMIAVREDGPGLWIQLRSEIDGMKTYVYRDPSGSLVRRRYRWMYGIGWDEEWANSVNGAIVAPRISIRVRVRERQDQASGKAADFELKLPDDVRVVLGSRK